MAEQLLHRAQIGTAIEEVRGERVAESVRIGGCCGSVIEDAPHVPWRQGAALAIEKDPVGWRLVGHELGTSRRQPGRQRLAGWFAQR